MTEGDESKDLLPGRRERAASPSLSNARKAAMSLKACLEYAVGQAAEAGFGRTAQILHLAISSIDEDPKLRR